jgi:hypothetical protein
MATLGFVRPLSRRDAVESAQSARLLRRKRRQPRVAQRSRCRHCRLAPDTRARRPGLFFGAAGSKPSTRTGLAREDAAVNCRTKHCTHQLLSIPQAAPNKHTSLL